MPETEEEIRSCLHEYAQAGFRDALDQLMLLTSPWRCVAQTLSNKIQVAKAPTQHARLILPSTTGGEFSRPRRDTLVAGTTRLLLRLMSSCGGFKMAKNWRMLSSTFANRVATKFACVGTKALGSWSIMVICNGQQLFPLSNPRQLLTSFVGQSGSSRFVKTSNARSES